MEVSTEEPKELDLTLASGGALWTKLVRSGLVKGGLDGAKTRIAIVVCLTYVPLAALSWWQGHETGLPLFSAFLSNFIQSVRFLVVMPLLIIAEVQIRPWVTYVVRYFVKSGLLPTDQMDKYIEIIDRAQRRRDSLRLELILLIGAFSTSAFGLTMVPSMDINTWQYISGHLSWAGLWCRYLSIPLFRFAWMTWIMRIIIWCGVLFRVSRLRLNLVPTHPDGRGGLGFLASGHNNFAILTFAMACQVSSVMADEILYHGHTINELKATIVLIVVVLIAISLLPLAIFTPKLIESKRLGLYHYGILAKQYVDSYHSKWVNQKGKHDDVEAIESDSKMQDSFRSVGSMQVTVFDKASISTFLIAAVAPFAPLFLTIYNFDQLLDQVLKKLL